MRDELATMNGSQAHPVGTDRELDAREERVEDRREDHDQERGEPDRKAREAERDPERQAEERAEDEEAAISTEPPDPELRRARTPIEAERGEELAGHRAVAHLEPHVLPQPRAKVDAYPGVRKDQGIPSRERAAGAQDLAVDEQCAAFDLHVSLVRPRLPVPEPRRDERERDRPTEADDRREQTRSGTGRDGRDEPRDDDRRERHDPEAADEPVPPHANAPDLQGPLILDLGP
jgi:hypothetical protein